MTLPPPTIRYKPSMVEGPMKPDLRTSLKWPVWDEGTRQASAPPSVKRMPPRTYFDLLPWTLGAFFYNAATP
ncbi:hypothetical protein CY34DRAFT_236848 [Suillus luteus UH-Slu-Lm8-n1]|uniref:Uncharacterized protein n=1 Tax=Suillus luteus UH-Slu-Lm8-n1 TaxID=930992 RepID=A0A0C9ZT26_9AGAM|nr:hypothetical protein CY34DRAFT_236848 [Suillus luteus UH-Slu-Lm8-n1]